MMPTFMPRFFANSATDSRRRPSGATPSAPLFAFSPQAIAVAAAAESVTRESAEQVRVTAENGNAFIASEPLPILRENSSAIIRCGTLMPSPMKRITFLGASARTESARVATDAQMSFLIVLYLSLN